jgi:hypothetical protein
VEFAGIALNFRINRKCQESVENQWTELDGTISGGGTHSAMFNMAE